MTDHQHEDHSRWEARPGRHVRMVREPSLTAKEYVAFALILVMVCGPLALGAFGL